MGSIRRKNENETTTVRWKKYCTFVGCCVLLMPNGLFWYWGNMAVYCKSYLVSVVDSTYGVDSSWVLSMFVVLWTVSVTFSDAVARRIGRRCTVLVGILIFDTGVFCSYLAVQKSLLALTITMGCMVGLGTGLIDGSALQIGIEWSTKNEVGRFTAIVQGFLSFGALVINQMVTRYVNPRNLSPAFDYRLTKYFAQKKILDKVPSMFIIVGSFSLVLHIIGLLMVKQNSSTGDSIQRAEIDSEKLALKSLAEPGEQVPEMKPSRNVAETEKREDIISPHSERGSSDHTCKQVLQTKSFYALWGTFFVMGLPFVLGSNYYKMFGQIWIKDDYFMADIATFVSLICSVISAFWGFAMDLYGVKNCQAVITVSLALVLFWYYFTAMVNRWLYCLAVFLLMSLAGPMISCYTAATAILYGKTNFTTNLGLVMTAQLSFHILNPFIIGRVLNQFGWFVIYVSTGAIVFLSLIPTSLFIPSI